MVTQLTVTNPNVETPSAPEIGTQSFVQRLIRITVKLATNTQTNQPNVFSNSTSTTNTIEGARTSVAIEHSGAPAGSKAHVKVYGLTPDLMNQLNTLGILYDLVKRNQIVIEAGDAVNGLSVVYSGTILAAYADYNRAPDVAFEFACQSGLVDSVVTATVSSFTGSTDVATIMQGFATKMGLGFENNGVSVKLSNPVFSGSIFQQMRDCAVHANINAEPIDGNLCIWPKKGSRNTPSIPLLSKDTGMIGYPMFEQPGGIVVKTLYNPKIVFGGLIKVQSTVPGVTNIGTWSVWKIDHNLESLVPKGNWMSTIHAYNPNSGQPPPVTSQPLP